jgi:ATP-dependent Zn protease
VAFTVGWLVDGASDQCEGAISCAASLPALLSQNAAELVGFALRFAVGLSQLFGVMWLLARMDLHTTILPDSIRTRFSDVWGQDKAVGRLKETLGILNHPDEVEARGGYMPGGILLWGPPGTGKSYLAEATAGESGKPFVNVGADSFASMWMGVPILKMKMIFKYLRRMSVKHGGVVVFFDEIDAIGSRGMGVVNQFLFKLYAQRAHTDNITIGGGMGGGALQMMLSEMSGMAKPKGFYNKIRVVLGFKPVPPPRYRILWISATNMVETLDPALLRPGRFDRKIHMGYPSIPGRTETFRGYLANITHNLTDSQVETLARENPTATGASIKDVVNEGLLTAVREGRDTVSFDDVRDAILWKMMGEEEGRMDLEADRHRVSVHEAAHAVASHHFRPEAPIQFASVIRRAKNAGFVRAVDLEDKFTLRSRLIADIKVSLASVWAEKTWFNDDISTGPASDLEKATAMAKAMWGKYAMGTTLMVHDPNDLPDTLTLEIQDWLHGVYDELHTFMWARRDQVELVAGLLDEQGTVDGEVIHALLRRTA